MRNVSLRQKVGFGLVGFTLTFVLTLTLVIGFAFEPIYYGIQRHNMATLAEDVGRIYKAEGSTGIQKINELTDSTSADVFVIDQGVLVYLSGADRTRVLSDSTEEETASQGRRLIQSARANVPQHIRIIVSLLRGYDPPEEDLNKIMYYTDNNSDSIRFYSLVSRISDHVYVTISQPLAPLRENVKIVQRFILMLGLIWIALALWGAFHYSKKLTDPLYELKGIAMHMAHLDFSCKWERTGTSEEISMVGETLNTLSSKLNQALEDLQQSNTALQIQLDKATEIEYMRKSFISAVSHELKTPLAIIQGYAEALEDLQNLPVETQEHYCSVICSETRKMDGLVRDLLNLSRLEAGRLQLELTDFDFAALMEESKIRFKEPAKEKGIHLFWALPDEMPCYGDPGRYDIILNNFLSNAIDYTPVNGCIKVSVTVEESDYLIEVFNEGETIPEEFHTRIWEPFFKVDSSHTRDAQRKFGGHGLGLGIVASLLTLHEQRYGVRNEKDGVTFWFTVAKEK